MSYKLVMKKKGYVVITFKFRREGKKWSAFCEELGTATFGRSIQEAQRKLEDSVLLQLNTLEEVGEIDNFFKEFNIAFHSHAPKNDEIKISGPFDTNTYVRPYVYPLHKEELSV
jgi:predicted RNase H-like HicB family nuclease